MVRAIRIFEVFLLVAFATSVSVYAQVPSVSAEKWQAAPTKEALMDRLKKRDATFGDYLIEFNLTSTRQRNPLAEWHSTNWNRSRPPARPARPPKDLDPPHLELKVQDFLFATHAGEECLDWHITEIRKDGETDEDDDRNGKGARYATWGEIVRSEYYSTGDEEKPPKEVYEGDPTVAQLHKDNPVVPTTILDSNRMYYELGAGIGMSKRIQQIDNLEVRDGLLHVSGKISHVHGRNSEFEMELTTSLLPRRILITIPQQESPDGVTKYHSNFLVQTEGEMQYESAPDTPESVKFEYTTTIDPAEGKTWVRENEKFELRFTDASSQFELDDFLRLARLKLMSKPEPPGKPER